MTTRQHYTDAEWKTLAIAPVACGYAVAMSELGVFSSAAEGSTLGQALATASDRFPAHELIHALFTANDQPVSIQPQDLGTTPAAALQQAITLCHAAIALLQERSPAELANYQTLCYSLAEQVAHATAETPHSHQPIRPHQPKSVGEHEQETLHQQRSSLGLEI